jgi:hypothetical protein
MRTVLCGVTFFATLLSSALVAAGTTRSDAVYCERATDFGIPWTTSLRGDVDGDGVIDTVVTRATWLGGGACRAWLVVDTARARFRAAIDPLIGALVEPPGLAGLIQLRPGHRLDVAVVVWLGASTGFLDVYGLRRHRLARVSRSAYEYAGSVVNRAGVDTDRRYHVERTFYTLRATVLSMVPRLTERHLVRIAGLARYQELAVQVPFPSCTAVLGTS